MESIKDMILILFQTSMYILKLSGKLQVSNLLKNEICTYVTYQIPIGAGFFDFDSNRPLCLCGA